MSDTKRQLRVKSYELRIAVESLGVGHGAGVGVSPAVADVANLAGWDGKELGVGLKTMAADVKPVTRCGVSVGLARGDRRGVCPRVDLSMSDEGAGVKHVAGLSGLGRSAGLSAAVAGVAGWAGKTLGCGFKAVKHACSRAGRFASGELAAVAVGRAGFLKGGLL